jgi:hypothetical protein
VLFWNVTANAALTLNLQRGYQDVVTPTERADWVRAQIRWTKRLGLEPRVTIVRWDRSTTKKMPEAGPIGSFLVVDDCKALRLSDGEDWLQITAPDAPALCDALDS